MSVRTKVFLVASIPLSVAVVAGIIFSISQANRFNDLSRARQDLKTAWELTDCYSCLLTDSTIARALLNGEDSREMSEWFGPKIVERKALIQKFSEQVQHLSDDGVRPHVITVTQSYEQLLASITNFIESPEPHRESLATDSNKLVQDYLTFLFWFEQEVSFEDFRLLFVENSVRQFHSRLLAALEVAELDDASHKRMYKIMASAPSPAAKGLETAKALIPTNKSIEQITQMIIQSKKKLVPTVPHSSFDYFTYSREPGWKKDAQEIARVTQQSYLNLQAEILTTMDQQRSVAFRKLCATILQMAVLLIVTGVLTMLTGMSIVQPLSALASAAGDLAKGEIRVSDSHVISDRHDEIAEVSRAFGELHQNMDALSEELRSVQSAILSGSPHARTRSERFEGTWGEIAKDMNLALQHFTTVNEEKLEAEQILQESQRRSLVGKMAGGMAHDFNNLLSVIIGFTDLAKSSKETDHSALLEIEKASNTAKDLIARIMAIGRKSELSMQTLAINDLINDSKSSIEAILPSNIHFNIELDNDEIGYISTDSTSFSQILLNLAVNARDAMKAGGGHLTVKCSRFKSEEASESIVGDTIEPGNYWCLEMRDQGCGIPQDALRKIFEPFYTTKEVTEGTGLGLAMVHSLIQQSGGWLDLKSTEGEGTSFFLYFPEVPEEQIEQCDQLPAHNTDASEFDADKLNILLVDDEVAVRMFTRLALKKFGHNVFESEDGEQGYDCFRSRYEDTDKLLPDLIISDVMMPKSTGPEMLERIQREFRTDIPTIFISGYSADQLDSETNLTNSYRLKKPFTLEQLQKQIDQVREDQLELVS